MITGPEDIPAVRQIQSRYKLTALSEWGKENQRRSFAPEIREVADLIEEPRKAIDSYWSVVNEALSENPADEIDGPIITLFQEANSQSKCNSARKKGGDLEYFALPQTTKNEEGLVKYHQISSGERYRISALRQEGYCPAAIARRIGRHRSSISRELRRNCSPWDGRYRPSKAQEQANG